LKETSFRNLVHDGKACIQNKLDGKKNGAEKATFSPFPLKKNAQGVLHSL